MHAQMDRPSYRDRDAWTDLKMLLRLGESFFKPVSQFTQTTPVDNYVGGQVDIVPAPEF